MNVHTLQPDRLPSMPSQDGPTMAHMAGAFSVLIASSAAFVVMFVWPLVSHFV